VTFETPFLLYGLVLVFVLAALYVLAQRRLRRYTLRYSSTALVREAIGPRPGRRRHVPAALYLAALSAMIVGLARPQAVVPNPEASGTVILVIDSSRSMASLDIAPSRIDAAKTAVAQFVEKQPGGIKIGVVAFAGGALLVTPPTNDRKKVLASVNSLSLGSGTNIGAGLQVALEALLPPGALTDTTAGATPGLSTQAPDDPGASLVILLSDGASTTGPPPLEVAQVLSKAGVRTYTVGLGTLQGGFGGRGARQLNEPTLKGIAEETGGQYFNAESAKELHQVYDRIATNNELVQKRMEVTFLAAAAGVLLMLAGGVLGMLWSNRLP
jgi:Ca-activated chloride channel family protein